MNFEQKRRIEVIIDVVSEKFGIPCRLVEDGPSTAWCDGKTVSIARLRLLEMLKDMKDSDITFLIIHEAAHARYSDSGTMAAVNNIMEQAGHKKTGISKIGAQTIFNFTQALEDIRIETKAGEDNGGAKRELDTKIQETFECHKEHFLKEMQEINPRSVSMGTLAKYRSPKFYKKDVPENIKKIVDEIEPITDKLFKAKDSWGTLRIAKEVYSKTKKYFEDMTQPPENPMEPPPESKEEKKEDKEDKKKSGGSGKGEGEKKEKSKGEKPESKPKEKPEDKDKEDKEKDGGKEEEGKEEEEKEEEKSPEEKKELEDAAGDSEEKLDDFMEEVEAEMGTVDKDGKPDGVTVLADIPNKMTVEFDIDESYPILEEAKAGDREYIVKCENMPEYERLYNNLSSTVRLLQKRIKDMFTLKAKTRYRSGFNSGRLISARDLWKTSHNDDKVFMRRQEKHKIDYAITVLIDQSGSMNGPKIIEAKRSLIILGEVLDSLSIPFELLGFSTDNQVCVPGEHPPEYRADELEHMIYKTFDERYDRKVKGRIGTIKALRNNFDGEAILWAYKRLSEHIAREKLLIVLSDGEPQGTHSSMKNASFTRAAVRSIQRRVKVIGVGYQSREVEKFYKNFILVHGIDELAPAFCKILYKTLSEGAGME